MVTASQHRSEKWSLGKIPTGWSWFAGGPLRGCCILREKQRVLAWDAGGGIYLLDLNGDLISQTRFEGELVGVAGADSGAAVVAISRAGKIWWLNGELNLAFEQESTFENLAVAVDARGYYAVISGHSGQLIVVGRDGKRVSAFETRPAVKFLAMTANDGHIVAASDNGLLGMYDWHGGTFWEERLWTNLGGLAIDGTGESILVAAFNQGIIRFNSEGKKEGSYRTENPPALVAVDFPGRKIICVSLENTFTALSFEGTVVGNKILSDAVVSIALDALGRFGVIAFRQGELRLFALDGFFGSNSEPRAKTLAGGVEGLVEVDEPSWEYRACVNQEEAETALIASIPGTSEIALYTKRNSVRVIDDKGKLIHEGEARTGIGRTFYCNDRWLAAGTSTSLWAYDPNKKRSMLFEDSLYDLSHVEPLSDFGDLLIVQSCQYLSRVQLPDAERWRTDIEQKVESIAAQANGTFALALEDHSLRIFDGQSRAIGKYRSKKGEPISVVAIDEGWATLTQEERVLRGHELNGKILWVVELPWVPWSMRRLGEFIVVIGRNGASLLVNFEGAVVGDNREPREHAEYFLGPGGTVCRAYKIENTLLVADFAGRLLLRHLAAGKIGAIAGAGNLVWAIAGKLLIELSMSAGKQSV